MSLIDFDKYNDFPALYENEREVPITYAEIRRRISFFSKKFPPFKSLFIIEASVCVEFIVAYLAAIESGHSVILVSDGATDYTNKLIRLYNPNFTYTFLNGKWTLSFINRNALLLNESLAVLLSTSGSSGDPKLVMLSKENIISNARSISTYLNLTSKEKAMTSLPFHYSYGLSVLNSHLFSGASIVLNESSVIEEGFWVSFRKHSCTSFAGVPYTYELLKKNGFLKESFPSLRYFTQAGGKLPLDLASEFCSYAKENSKKFYIMYGQTEATARMAYLPLDKLEKHADCIGIAIPDGKLKIIAEGEEVSVNQVGELVYTGPNVMMGYASGVDDLAKDEKIEELYTGDLAVKTDNGLFKVVGRKKRFIKLFGLRISLDEVDSILSEKKLVAYVVGSDDYLACFTTRHEDESKIKKVIIEKLKLPEHSLVVSHLAKVPLLSSGKVDVVTLKNTANTLYEAKSLGGKSNVIEIFESVFNQFNISEKDSFVSLSGDSLSYVTMSMHLEKYLGYLPDNWQLISINKLNLLPVSKNIKKTKISTEVLIRTIAILGVVVTHAHLLPLHGSAILMLMLAGFSLSRFRMNQLMEGDVLGVVLPIVRNVIIPFYILTLIFFIYKNDIHWPTLLLVSNITGGYLNDVSSFLTPFWFIAVYFQIILILCILFYIKPIRNLYKKNDFIFSICLLVLSFLLKIVADEVFVTHGILTHQVYSLIFVFLIGFCFQSTIYNYQKLLVFIISCMMFLLSFDLFKSSIFILSVFFILFIPKINLYNEYIKIFIQKISESSFYIYLLHMVPINFLVYKNDALIGGKYIAVFSSLLIGLFVHKYFFRKIK